MLANSDPSSTGNPPGVVLDPPGVHKDERGVSLYLLECVPDPPLRGHGRPPLRIRLRYLVTAWGASSQRTEQNGGQSGEQEMAHHLLGLLLFAAMQDSATAEGAINGMEVDLTPPAPEIWLGLGVKPQPSFVLVMPVVQERPQPQVRYVRQPLVVQVGTTRSVSGTVVGPGDIPLAGARVEVPGLNVHEQTDVRGRFSFRSMPNGPRPLHLRILAKGRSMEYVVAGQASDPLTIKFDLLEKEK